MYYTVMMTNGTMKALDNHPSYYDAEETFDFYCDSFPHAWIEIVSEADYNHCISLGHTDSHSHTSEVR